MSRQRRGGALVSVLAVSLTLTALPSTGSAADPCETLLRPDAVTVFTVQDLGFDCEAPPCYNIRATAVDGDDGVDVADIVACPATAGDRDALRSAIDRLPFGGFTTMIGHLAERTINGQRATVLVATRVTPPARP